MWRGCGWGCIVRVRVKEEMGGGGRREEEGWKERGKGSGRESENERGKREKFLRCAG